MLFGLRRALRSRLGKEANGNAPRKGFESKEKTSKTCQYKPSTQICKRCGIQLEEIYVGWKPRPFAARHLRQDNRLGNVLFVQRRNRSLHDTRSICRKWNYSICRYQAFPQSHWHRIEPRLRPNHFQAAIGRGTATGIWIDLAN